MSTLYVNTITPNSGDTVSVSGSLTVSGKFTIGDASTDTVAITAEISSSIIPDVDSTYNIGSAAQRWAEGYIDLVSGSKVDVTSVTASIVSASTLTGILSTAAQANVTSVGTLTSLIVGGDISSSGQVNLTGNVTASGNISASTITANNIIAVGTVQAEHITSTDDMTVTDDLTVDGTSSFGALHIQGGPSRATISGSLIASTISTGNPAVPFTLGTMAKPWGGLHVHGLGHIHTASLNVVSSSLIPNADDTYDLGSSTKQWNDLYVDGIAYIDDLRGADELRATNVSSSNVSASVGLITTLTNTTLTSTTANITTLNISSSDHNAQDSVDGAHFNAATLGNKFTVKGQLQAAVADDTVSALFTVSNTSINQDSTIFGNLIYSQSIIDANATHINSLSQSNMLINVVNDNSMSFAFANSSGVAVVDNSTFTASFVIL
tara:strand:- start:1710 stop:3020 length:1311 start_codon:yes stop_codon:yes gene_type:complete